MTPLSDPAEIMSPPTGIDDNIEDPSTESEDTSTIFSGIEATAPSSLQSAPMFDSPSLEEFHAEVGLEATADPSPDLHPIPTTNFL